MAEKKTSEKKSEQTQTPADIRHFWKLMAPRLTVLVTTVDSKGRPDVAPISFVSPVSFDPPLLMISVGVNKHSYWNMIQKKEFVVNIPTEKLLDKIWIAGEKWDPEASKIERAGLKTDKSEKVGPPRLTECAANIECYMESANKCGDHVIIVGKVVAIRVKSEYIDDEGRLKVELARPPLHVSENIFAFPYVTKTV
jgi:flavin reductase (DIM6/NTAB) family NADH-FMN oxidoreductase RutF